MAEKDLISPHRYIKHTSTGGAVLTENKLETGKKEPSITKAVKNRSTQCWLEGNPNNEVRTHTPGRRHRRGRRVTWAQRFSLRNEQFKPHVGHPNPGV